jgi:hypothetical protein
MEKTDDKDLAPKRRPWVAPDLVEYGTVEDITSWNDPNGFAMGHPIVVSPYTDGS